MQTEKEKRQEFGKQKFDEGFAYCEEKHKMIAVTERLPDKNGEYLVQIADEGFGVLWFEQGNFLNDFGSVNAISWQHLPQEIGA